MTIILAHSPKGGVGNSFVAAQLALHLAARGHDVSALDFTFQDALKIYFGFQPTQGSPEMTDTNAEALVSYGVSLAQGYSLSRAPAFRERLRRGHDLPFDENRISIIDVSSEDRELVECLLPLATLHICTLMPNAASLATLSKIGNGTPAINLDRSVFVLNQVDDRQRLSRHTQGFLRDLFGEQIIASIHRDEAVNEAVARFEPIAKYAPTSAILPDLARLSEMVEDRLGLTGPQEAEQAVGGQA